MDVGKLVEWQLVGETEAVSENLPQRHFVHLKANMTGPRRDSGPPWWEAGK
jgi:hypothetical protein